MLSDSSLQPTQRIRTGARTSLDSHSRALNWSPSPLMPMRRRRYGGTSHRSMAWCNRSQIRASVHPITVQL